jgi:hypothetical protein
MNMSQLAEKISNEINLPIPKTRQAIKATLENLSTLVSEGEQFRSPILWVTPLTIPAQEKIDRKTGKKTRIAEKRIGRLIIREKS